MTLLAGNDIVDADGNGRSRPRPTARQRPLRGRRREAEGRELHAATTFADGTLHLRAGLRRGRLQSVEPRHLRRRLDRRPRLVRGRDRRTGRRTTSSTGPSTRRLTGSGTLTLTVQRRRGHRCPIGRRPATSSTRAARPRPRSTVPDTTPPAFANFDWFGTPATASSTRGEQFIVAISWDEPVVVTGTPRLPLTLAARAAPHAVVRPGFRGTSKTAYFVYTVAPGHNDRPGSASATLVLSGGTIDDAAGHPATAARAACTR